MRMNRPRMLAYIPTVRLAAGLALTVLTVTACGSGGSSDVSQSGTSTTPNRAPSIQSFGPEEILEGSQLSVAIVSSDPDGDSLDRSISGPDTPFFTINEEDFIELAVLPDSDRRGMTASGMIVINPPWKLEQQMNNVLPWLHSKLVPAGTGHATVSWIVPE